MICQPHLAHATPFVPPVSNRVERIPMPFLLSTCATAAYVIFASIARGRDVDWLDSSSFDLIPREKVLASSLL